MKRCIAAAALAAVIASGQFATEPAVAGSGVNVGSLNCKVAGGSGFIFGSTKNLSCLFTRADGTGERYSGEIKKYGVDIGFTDGAYMRRHSMKQRIICAGRSIGPGVRIRSCGNCGQRSALRNCAEGRAASLRRAIS